MTIGSLMVDAAGKIASPSFSNVSPLSRSRMTYPEAPRNSEVSRASVDSSFIRISARFGSAGGDNGAATLGAGRGRAPASVRSVTSPGTWFAPDRQTITRSVRANLMEPLCVNASGAGARNEGHGRITDHRLLPARADGGDDVGEQGPSRRHRRIAPRPARCRSRENALKGAARHATIDAVEGHRVHGGEGHILPAPAARRQEQRIEG